VWAVIADRPQPRLDPPSPKSLTLGALEGYFTALLDAPVRRAYERALDRLRSAGVTLDARAIAGASTIVESYTNISLPEAAHWHAATLDSHAADYQPIVRQRLEFGRTIPAVAYLRAMDARAQLVRAVEAAFDGCDALVLPTLPIVAPKLGETDVVFESATGGTEKLTARMALLRLTQLFNLTGHPAISLPIPSDGLPVGLQLVGPRARPDRLLHIAGACERLFDSAS
jgi:Asp-tRNA(Asn)/Glu-tRNA(Gln) amidotransferase A subunit family amidase